MLSHIVRLPELSELEIPEKQLRLHMTDDVIFCDLLNEKRTVTERDGAAEAGDYVLIRSSAESGGEEALQIELGQGRFPEYERAIAGHRAGDVVEAVINGGRAVIKVESVKQVVDMPLTDESMAALGLPGITSLADYRRDYIGRHGEERADRVFSAIQGKLIERLVSLAEVDIDAGELKRFHQKQRIMIQNISDDVDKRLMDAYHGDTPEEADRLFFADNRRSFVTYLCGLEYAARDGREPNEEERSQALWYYGLIYGKSEDEIVNGGLLDEALQSFYIQYAIGKIRAYYKSLVRFYAEGVEPLSL